MSAHHFGKTIVAFLEHDDVAHRLFIQKIKDLLRYEAAIKDDAFHLDVRPGQESNHFVNSLGIMHRSVVDEPRDGTAGVSINSPYVADDVRISA